MCDYQGYEFGANYLDSVCIDGYLWDADSGGPGEELTSGGEQPCPQCNHQKWLEWMKDDIVEQGWFAAQEQKNRADNEYLDTTRKLRYEEDRSTLIEWWNQGFDECCKDHSDGKSS